MRLRIFLYVKTLFVFKNVIAFHFSTELFLLSLFKIIDDLYVFLIIDGFGHLFPSCELTIDETPCGYLTFSREQY